MFSARSFSEVARSCRSAASVLRIGSPAPGALDRFGAHAAVGRYPQETLRGRAGHREAAEPQVAREGRRVPRAQRQVRGPRLEPVRGHLRGEGGGEADLVRVALGDLVLGVGDLALVAVLGIAAGERRGRERHDAGAAAGFGGTVGAGPGSRARAVAGRRCHGGPGARQASRRHPGRRGPAARPCPRHGPGPPPVRRRSGQRPECPAGTSEPPVSRLSS